MTGSRGEFFGEYATSTLQKIPAFKIELPAASLSLPKLDHVDCNTLKALVDFHESFYKIPDKFIELAHQVLAADTLVTRSS